MEESLYDIYNRIYITKEWSYYKAQKESFDFSASVLCALSSQRFIESYFSDGGKSTLMEGIRFSKIRSNHTVSCFFLGIYLHQCFGIGKRKHFQPSFLYLWFLTCLYHDAGFFLEENSFILPQIETDIVEIDKIDYKSIPEIITKGVIGSYSSYRSGSVNIDHGIISGKMLYDRLIQNYNTKKEQAGNDRKEFVDKVYGCNLKLSDKHFPYYSQAATAIIAHNIFIRPTEEDVREQYRQHGLENLIDAEKYKFSYDQSLFFLLLIADSLEPLKRFSSLNAESVLKKIYFSKNEDGLRISYEGLSGYTNLLNDWIKQVLGLNLFTNLNIREEGNSILLPLSFLNS